MRALEQPPGITKEPGGLAPGSLVLRDITLFFFSELLEDLRRQPLVDDLADEAPGGLGIRGLGGKLSVYLMRIFVYPLEVLLTRGLALCL